MKPLCALASALALALAACGPPATGPSFHHDGGAGDGGANTGADGGGGGADGGGGGADGGGGGADAGDVTAAAQGRSGTRLKARWIASPDGARQLLDWHDVQVGVDCNFYVVNGVETCVPTSFQIGATSYFADSSCSTPLYVTSPNGCGSLVGDSMLIAAYGNTCGAPAWEAYTVTGLLSSGATVWYWSGGCQSTTAASSVDYYTLSPLTLGQYATAAIVVDP